jgi:hypothetical protein
VRLAQRDALGVERLPQIGRGQRLAEGGPGVFEGDVFEIELSFHWSDIKAMRATQHKFD